MASFISRSWRRLTRTDWLAITLFLVFVITFAILNIRSFQAFQFGALDLAKFDQGIWNTAQGRPYQITLAENSVIQSHFSPSLALFAPLYWIWPDIRLLFILQSILLAGAGLLIYGYFRGKRSWLGLVVFAAYLMHPSLHQVTLIGFRRLTLAVFATSFMIYHLLKRQYGWAALGLVVALLSKEDMAFVAIMAGLYVLLVQRSYKWGALFLLTGLAWMIFIPFAVLPALSGSAGAYTHADANFSYLGDTLPEILQTLRQKPTLPWQYALQPARLTAVWRFFWPTLFLFLLAPEIAIFLAPFLGFYLTSVQNELGELKAWYPSVLLIILYWAVALGLARLFPRISSRWHKVIGIGLLLTSLIAWVLSSQLWPGPNFDKERYQVSEHDRHVVEILRQIPQEVTVAAQDSLVPHLAHREEIYLYPWIFSDAQAEYIIFDRELSSTYPLSLGEYRTYFYDIFAETEYELVEQWDSLYVFQRIDKIAPNTPRQDTFGNLLTLLGYTVAFAPPGEPFQTDLPTLPGGTQVRVTLFWQIEQETAQNYSVFTHLAAPDGFTLAQHDSWPADDHRPTSTMPAGKIIRDTHYLTLPSDAATNELSVRVGVYESLTREPLLTPSGESFIVVPLR